MWAEFLDVDYLAIFQRLPVPFMVLDRELRFADANAAYCAVTMSRREDLIGRHVFDAFPETGENRQRYQDAFERTLRGEANVVALFPFAIPRPAEAGGGMDTRYWSCTHTPIRDAAGVVTHIVQQTEDVTELMRNNDPAMARQVAQRARQLESLSERLRAEGAFLKRLFESAPGFMAVLTGPDLVFELANSAFQRLVGRTRLIGRRFRRVLPRIDIVGAAAVQNYDMNSGQPFTAQAFPVSMPRSAGGSREKRYIDFVWQPILDEAGVAVAVFVQGHDVTERVHATEQQRLLLDEVNHRVKNTLAVVQALVLQTLKSSESPRAFSEKLQSRLGALSITHNLLTESAWKGVDLKTLLTRELGHYGENRIVLDGPLTLLSPRRAVNLGLVFHELATNAAKYGALSVADGVLGISWRIDRDTEPAQLVIDWNESNGPVVVPPATLGFGTRLIERTIRAKPDARYHLDYRPDGLKAHFSMTAETP